MSTPESLMEALGRGLASVILQAQKEPKEKRPQVIKQDDVRKAVAEFLGPLVEEPTPPQQMDIFSADPDEIAEMTLRKVHEARERAAAQDQEEENPPRPTTYDPNAPNPSPWMSP